MQPLTIHPPESAAPAETPLAEGDEQPQDGEIAPTGRLVIVSNRVANLRSGSQSGGLAVGLADAVMERGGIWFGWNGEREGVTGGDLNVETIGRVERIEAPLSPQDFSDYYLGYANSVLWPLF